MRNTRLPAIRVGDIIEVDQGHYCYGLGRLLLEVIEVGHRERHTDGVWLNLRGVELRNTDRVRLRQRRVLVRVDTVRIRPGPLTHRRWIRRNVDRNRAPAATPLSLPPIIHIATKPEWTCANCGEDWPCPTRRTRLLAKYADDRLLLPCVRAVVTSAVSPEIWKRSLDERLVNYDQGHGLDGYVWGVRWQMLFPGMKLMPTSLDAKQWSRDVDLPFHEAVIETNGHNIFLVFSDLAVDTIDIGHAPFVVSPGGPDYKFPLL
jgi:hypothetical protein